MKLLFFLAVICNIWSNVLSLDSNNDLHGEWQAWKKQYQTHYPTMKEDNHRFEIWQSNYHKIEDHNNEESSYKLAMNKFGDLTQKEFAYVIHGHNESCLTEFNNSIENIETINPGMNMNFDDLPESVDWTADGYVTAVKDQGSCGYAMQLQ